MREFNFKNHTSKRCTTFPFGLHLPHDPFYISDVLEGCTASVQGTVRHQSTLAFTSYSITTIDHAYYWGILKITLSGGVQPSRLG